MSVLGLITAAIIAMSGPVVALKPTLLPGDHTRILIVDGRERSYLVHVPAKHDRKHPTPVVLVFHGAGTNGEFMVRFTGMNEKADEAGFLTVYANGTGIGRLLTFNSGGFPTGRKSTRPDDVKYVDRILDDLAGVANVDKTRVYATGLSNGGMMCYRLAAELSHRIAAIAPIAGTLGIEHPQPKRPVPIMHFHGTADRIVPYNGPKKQVSNIITFYSVEDTVAEWIKLNRCEEKPVEKAFEDKAKDGMTCKQKTYRPKKGGAEVILITIEGGGHTWPGRPPRIAFIGKSTKDISANDLIWEFFQRHRLPK